MKKYMNKKKNSKKVLRKSKDRFWLILFSLSIILFTGILIIGISFYGLGNRNKNNKVFELSQYYQDVDAPAIILKVEGEIEEGKEAKLLIYVNTNDEEIDEATAVINYDDDEVDIESVSSGGSLFDEIERTNRKEQIEIRASNNNDDLVKGTGLIATISFVVKHNGNIDLDLVCDEDKAISSSMMIEDENIIDCDYSEGVYIAENSDLDKGVCRKIAPDRPTNLVAKTGSKSEEVELNWKAAEGTVTHYGITYGKNWIDGQGPNEYGALNIGKVTSYTVKGLVPGQLYYFVVYAINDCANSGYSDGAAAYAGQITGYSGNYGSGIKATTRPTVAATTKPTQLPQITPLPTIEAIASTAADLKVEYKPLTAPVTEEKIVEEETGESFWGVNTGLLLPIIGGIILILLGILFVVLFKYLRQENEIKEK